MNTTRLAAFVLAICSSATQADTLSLGLSNYTLTGNHTLDTLGGMGLEASAVTYAADRNSLFFVGDEGLGVVEISLTGQTLGSMAFSAWPAATTHHDAEGLTYLGGGVLAVAEERLQDAYRFTYQAGGSVDLSTAASSSIANYAYNNTGIEGLSVDARDGTFVAVKQDNDQKLLIGTLSFAEGGGTSNMVEVFSGTSLFGLDSLSDVQTLSGVTALAGTSAADNFLILSLDSKRLVEINRSGTVLGSLDLSGLTTQAIEGVTVDSAGHLYLIAEDSGTGASRLLVMSSVPEPETYALMLGGLSIVGWLSRRRRR